MSINSQYSEKHNLESTLRLFLKGMAIYEIFQIGVQADF